MAKTPKTCKGCLFCVPLDVAPDYFKPYCKLKDVWVNESDKACDSAKGRPRRRK